MDQIARVPELTESQSLRAMHLFLHGSDVYQISDTLSVPLACVEKWRADFEAVRAAAPDGVARE